MRAQRLFVGIGIGIGIECAEWESDASNGSEWWWSVGWSWIEAGRANGQWLFGIWYGLVCAEAVMYNGNGSSSGSVRTIERRAGQKAGKTKDYLQVSGYDEVVCERDGSQVLNGWKGLTKVLYSVCARRTTTR
jgi:hypothetical protein